MENENKKNRRKKIYAFLFALIFGLAAGAAGYVAYKQYFTDEPFSIHNVITRNKTPKPDTTSNPLDGTQVDKSLADRHPLAIIVENHPDARPQTGLDKASIVYEAITEGGITRFMAIFGPREADKVGPVRSLRTFFLDWSYEYNAFLAHVGGNIDALDRVPTEGTLDLDQFAIGTKAYWREPQAGKAIEHTMYTSTQQLYSVAKSKGWDLTGNFDSFKFLDPKKFKINQGNSQKITIDFSSSSYKVSYTYDLSENKYLRSMDGFAHKDRNTGNQLSPTNIIIQSVNRTPGFTRINEDSWTFDTIGEGKAIILYGGQKIDGNWKKSDLKSRTMFYNSSGKEIEFLPGQFWYEIVPPEVFDKVKIETTANVNTSPSPS